MRREIAIVEDEPDILDNYTDVLQRQGYQVAGFSNRADAIEAFNRGLPDLVILDIGLGDDIDGGFELCRQLRSMSDSLPII
ncbi:MAG: response regulator, partial [Chromatiales bacterium]|nr:response regulator [Chromatiales bacterium]